MRKRCLVIEDRKTLRGMLCDLRVELPQLWVVKRHGDHLVGTAEVPHIPDRLAPAPNTSPLCQLLTSASLIALGTGC